MYLQIKWHFGHHNVQVHLDLSFLLSESLISGIKLLQRKANNLCRQGCAIQTYMYSFRHLHYVLSRHIHLGMLVDTA